MKLPIYLYTGPEFGQRNDAIASVKKSFEKQVGQIEEHLFYLHETPLREIMDIIQNGTLFSDGVFVVCKGAELLKSKDDIKLIQDWLDNSPETAVLIFISDEISVDSKLDKIVPGENKKKFWEMFDSDKKPWVINFFSKNGYSLESSAADLILEMVENNTLALKNECSRFFILFPKEHKITAEDVEKVLVHTREENAFSLFNAIADNSLNEEKRLEAGISILQKIRLSKENSSVMIIAGLTSCFRKLSLFHKINSEYYDDMERAYIQNGFSSKLLRNEYKKAAKIWTKGQTTAILAILASTDMDIRSGGSAMEDVLLNKMLYEIIIKKGASIAKMD